MALSPSTFKPGIAHLTAGWPTYNSGARHYGIDLSCGVNSSDRVIAIEPALVMAIKPGDSKTSGMVQLLGKESGLTIVYKHMGTFVVSKGDEIEPGTVLATPNLTNTEELHLHFEVWDGSDNRNPLYYIIDMQPEIKITFSKSRRVETYYKDKQPEVYEFIKPYLEEV